MLLAATTRPGEPYDDLEEVYSRLLGQWVLEMNHVAAVVGGLDSRQRHGGQEGARFAPVQRERQARAVKFLNEHAFATPAFLIRPEVLRRIEPVGVLDRVKSSQQRVLASLLSSSRFTRLAEQEAIDGASAYRPTDFLSDVRRGIWKELDSPKVQIDPFRRNLQRVYLGLMSDRLNGRQAAADDQRPLLRGELRALAQAAGRALPLAGDRATRLHLEDTRDQIAKALDPKFAPASPQAQPAQAGRPGADESEDDLSDDPGTCWPDYAIRPLR